MSKLLPSFIRSYPDIPPCCLFVLTAMSPLSCALRTEHAAPPHSMPQPRPPPTLGVLEANTRYTPDNTAGFSAVRKGKSTWTGRSEEQAGSREWDSRRRIEGAREARRHRQRHTSPFSVVSSSLIIPPLVTRGAVCQIYDLLTLWLL